MKRWSHSRRVKKAKKELTPEQQFNQIVDKLERVWDEPSSAQTKLFLQVTDVELYRRIETAIQGRRAERKIK